MPAPARRAEHTARVPPRAHATRALTRRARSRDPRAQTPPRPARAHAVKNHHQINSIVVPNPAIWFSHRKRFQPTVARSLSASVTLR